MAAPEGSKGKAGASAPAPAKSKTATEPIAPFALPGEKADLAVPMVWCAFRNAISNSWEFEGVRFLFPNINTTLQQVDAPANHNVVVVPLPKDWVDGLAAIGYGVKIVGGKRCPALHLIDTAHATGTHDLNRIGLANTNLWSAYQQKHHPASLALSPADWRKDLSF